MLSGRVFVTGGAGFLARGLYRRAERENWPCEFTAFSRDDAKHVALMKRFPMVRCVRGDVSGHRDFLTAAMMGHETVIHAAAVKYVDLAETNVLDTVKVNVYGSENVAWAAIRAGVSRCIGISTDKACQPVNVYGMTKAVMERIFIEAGRVQTETDFTLCRYGNVVGSTGSVIPKFKEQLARDGVVSVTNPDMTRFWMSVDEAVDVIILASQTHPGSTVIPLPKAMTLLDVVHAALGSDFTKVRIVGVRPGEKMHEDLLHEQESVRARLVGLSGDWPDRHYELRPPGEILHAEPFSLPSSNPHAWLSAAEMAALIADAETV